MPHSTRLQAGPLTLLLEQGELRHIRWGGKEVLRRVYLTLRGPDWRTISPVLSDLKVDRKENSFQVSYQLLHLQEEFDFAWQVSVSGSPGGVIRFAAQGRAGSDFPTNRVGLCVLHPPAECAGRPARVTGPDGKLREGFFPETIDPQQPFLDIKEFAYQVDGDGWARLAYGGEVFEMEDQRNWTDGSFKTYCPPQDRPKPRLVIAGWECAPSVTLQLLGPKAVASDTDPSHGAGPAVIGLVTDRAFPLPVWGLGRASHGRMPGPGDVARLRTLGLSHLRADFPLTRSDWPERVTAAAAESRALGVPLEAAVLMAENGEAVLADFARAWKTAGAPVVRWLVFHATEDCTSTETQALARRHLSALSPEAIFVPGSKSDFVLLNRNRPAPAPDGMLAYAMTPQVHAFDNRTLVESLEGQEWTLRTAHALWPGRPLAISPVTLKRSPFAISLKLADPVPPGFWKSQADTRQISLFGAGWTLGCLGRLISQGAAAMTHFETTGLLGVMSGENLAGDDGKFPGSDVQVQPGWVYPMFHVFADLAEYRGGEALSIFSTRPQQFDGMGLQAGKRRTLLLANLEATPGLLRVEGLGDRTGLRRLNEKNALRAMEDPDGYRHEPREPAAVQAGALELEFLPFELIRVDWEIT